MDDNKPHKRPKQATASKEVVNKEVVKKKDTRFKKGNTAGVGNGRPKLTQEQKDIKKKLREHVIEVSRILFMNDDEFNKLFAEEKPTQLEKMLIIAINEQNWKAVDSILNRVIGKPRDSLELTTDDKTVFTLKYSLDK